MRARAASSFLKELFMNKLKRALICLAICAASVFVAAGFAACTDGGLEGEYHYANPWGGADYGVKVSVVVEEGVIQSVEVLPSEYTEVTDSWENKNVYLEGRDELLAAYVGKTVDEVLAIEVTCGVDGTPSAVGDSDFLISGATNCSGRLLRAVQDALRNYNAG